MRAEQLLKASSVHLAAGEAELAIDSAVWAHSLAADARNQAEAGVAAALALIELNLPADAVLWADRALSAVPEHRLALTCRGLGHRALRQLGSALADLDAAVGTGEFSVPGRARLGRALVLDEIGRRAEGRDELERAADDSEVGPLALRLLAGWSLAEGDKSAAVSNFIMAARLGDRPSLDPLLELLGDVPDDPEIWLTRVVALRGAGREPDAIAAADALLAREDLTPRVLAKALLNRGYLARAAGLRWSAATEWLLRAVEEAPDDAEALTACARALAETDSSRSESMLLRAVDLAPGDGVPECLLGYHYRELEDHGQAVAWYERAIEIVPCHNDARFGLATALNALGEAEDGARLARLAAIAGHPGAIERCRREGLPLPGDRMAEALEDLGSANTPFRVERVFREAAELWLEFGVAPGDTASRLAAKALRHAARCEIEMGDPSAAERTLTRAVELWPAYGEGWRALGDTHIALGRPRAAIEAYHRGAWCDPEDTAAPLGVADSYCRLGLGEQALAALDHAVEIGSRRDSATRRDLLFRRARLRQALGAWDDAVQDCERLLREFEDDERSEAYERERIATWARGVTAVRDLVRAGPEGRTAQEYRGYGLVSDELCRNGGIDWPWRVRFAEPPDAATRERLAAAAGRRLRAAVEAPDGSLAIDLAMTARWSDRFLLLRVRADEGENLGALRTPLALAVEAMHRVTPIVEVVNFAAWEVAPDDPLEAWSITVQPLPDAGPDFGVPAGFWVPKLVEPFSEDLGLAAESSAAQTEAATLTAGPPAGAEASPPGWFPEPVTDPAADAALWDAITGEIGAPEVKLVMIGPGDPPPPAQREHDLGPFRRHPHDYGRFAENGAGVIVRRPEDACATLDRVTAEGQMYQVIGRPDAQAAAAGLSWQVEAVSVAPSGGLAMFATGLGRDLYLLNLATGDTAVLLEGVPKVESTAFLGDGLIMVKTSEWLAVFTLTPDGPVLVGRDVVGTGTAVVAAGGRIIVVGGVREPELTVYAFAAGALGRIAEVSGPINCYRVWAVGDRVFAADRSDFELVGLVPAWEAFAAWAATMPGRDGGNGLRVEEMDDAPYTGIGDGIEGIRESAFWCVKGSAGLILAIRETEGAQEILVGDPHGVVPTTPVLRESGFEYDWRPDGGALLIRGQDSSMTYEVDVARATAYPVAYSASQACYTATGFAVLRPEELALYAWRHGSEDDPVELARYPVAPGATTLGWTDGGRIVHLTAQGSTGLYVIGDAAPYPIGAFPGDDWFSGWNHDGALYFANRHSGRDFRAYRVSGFNSAVVEALGRPPVDRLFPRELAPIRYVARPVYPGMTRWRYFSDE